MGLVMVVPLLAFYEVGTFAGGVVGEPASLRNGADAWVREWCEQIGKGGHLGPPIVMVGWLALAALRRWDSRPEHLISTSLGMLLESLGLALCLWLFSRLWPDLLKHYGWELQIKVVAGVEGGANSVDPMRVAIPLVGAGLYEEFLFRLVSTFGFFSLSSPSPPSSLSRVRFFFLQLSPGTRTANHAYFASSSRVQPGQKEEKRPRSEGAREIGRKRDLLQCSAWYVSTDTP